MRRSCCRRSIFCAESSGFNNLGLTIDYAKELPFSGSVVNRAWATSHMAALDKLLAALSRSVAWYYDPANRAEAIKIMIEASRLSEEDITKSYDFIHGRDFFEDTGKVSMAKMNAMLTALKELGDIEGSVALDRFVLPAVTQLTD
jgi:NitT/TauT family transport system substrate-binding protein